MIRRALFALALLVQAGVGADEGYVVGAFTWAHAEMHDWDQVQIVGFEPEAPARDGSGGYIDAIPLRRGSLAFVARLPVGRYGIVSLYDSVVGNQASAVSKISAKTPVTYRRVFTVKHAQVTDLGVLAMPARPKHQRPWIPTFARAGHSPSLLRFAALRMPEIRGAPVWRDAYTDAEADGAADLRTVAGWRAAASLHGAVVAVGEQELIGRSGHGGVHRYVPGSGWTVEDLGDPFAVETVGVADDGTLVAATEFGGLHVSRERGRWTVQEPPAGVWRITAIWFAPDGRLHIVGGRGLVQPSALARWSAIDRAEVNGRPETLAVYACNGTLPDCTWTELHARPWDDRVIDVVATPRSLIVFDEKERVWATAGSAQAPKFVIDADHVGVAGPDALAVWDQSGSKHSELRISNDLGATWRTLGDGSKKDAPMAKVTQPFVLAGVGDALFGKVRRKAGSQHYDFKLFMSQDSGARWLPVADHDPTCALDEWVGVVRGALLVNCGDGRVFAYDGVAAKPERLR